MKRVLPLLGLLLLTAGCQTAPPFPRVVYLDGAGWFSGDGPVSRGLRGAGFAGTVQRFRWSSYLGPLPDHLMAGPNHPRIEALRDEITALRRLHPNEKIVLMGLSAGTSIIVRALEKLPPDVEVDHVVLLSPSISSRHDLTRALRHVTGRLYATCSPHDALLSAMPSAGLQGGRPAGSVGFKPPISFDPARRELYQRVINLRWRPEYVAYGWDGGHVSVTDSDFIRVVVAPRIMDDLPHPLDRPMTMNYE